MRFQQLNIFNPRKNLDRGCSVWIESLWYVCKCIFFLSPWPWPSGLKTVLLRLFGAAVGKGVVIKPRVNIHLPWKLAVGDFSWLGEEVFVLNLEEVRIGSNCCISQRAFLCTGNHDFHDVSFAYRNRAIAIEDEAWVGAQVFVAPGVSVGSGAVVTAGSVVLKNLPSAMICSGNPCVPIRKRATSVSPTRS